MQGQTVQSFEAKKTGSGISLGKSPENQIILNDPSISEKHCSFEFDGKKIILRNFKSRNGVILNGERVKTETAEIFEKDEVKAGDFLISLTWVDSGTETAAAPGERKSNLVFFLLTGLLLSILVLLILPQPEKRITIPEPKPIREGGTISLSDKEKNSWRTTLSKAKDAYFNDKILEAARLFKEVLSREPSNMEAQSFLEQIKKEVVPKMEESIKTYIVERNIVSCATAVEELMLLDPENKCIQKAKGLLEGYSKFDAVRALFDARRFKQAQEDIQSIVLVDEETLSEWRRKIDEEVQVTQAFKDAILLYRNGPLPEAYRSLKKFVEVTTIQKNLQTSGRQKLSLIRRYAAFKKLENEDPLKQTTYGVSLLYDLSEKEDPLIWKSVNLRLDELTKQCGPGTDFYVLLKDDTMTQLDQARDYKNIHEVKMALKNYKSSLNGLRILAFFSKDKQFIDLEKNVYDEIVKYRGQLEKKVEEMKSINEFDGAKIIQDLLSQFSVAESSTARVATEAYQGEGDDMKVMREVFNAPVNFAVPVSTKTVLKTGTPPQEEALEVKMKTEKPPAFKAASETKPAPAAGQGPLTLEMKPSVPVVNPGTQS